MRAGLIAAMAAALAAAALAQQAPPVDQSETVAQPRFETRAQPEDAAAGEPRFVRAPGESGIVVTPLPPPGGATVTSPPGADIPLGEPGSGDNLPEQAPGVDVLRQQPGLDDPAEGPVFKSAPDTGGALVRPSSQAVPIDAPPTEPRAGVRLRELDKMTGQTETFELAVGETRQVDRLKIRLEACRSPESNDTHGTIAFLKVWDAREPEDEAFSGWMFAESPSLSALDHPRYDLWVISCTTSAVAASSASE